MSDRFLRSFGFFFVTLGAGAALLFSLACAMGYMDVLALLIGGGAR